MKYCDELFQAAEALRASVFLLDLKLTSLIGTEQYPNVISVDHMEVRDHALLYDDVIKMMREDSETAA